MFYSYKGKRWIIKYKNLTSHTKVNHERIRSFCWVRNNICRPTNKQLSEQQLRFWSRQQNGSQTFQAKFIYFILSWILLTHKQWNIKRWHKQQDRCICQTRGIGLSVLPKTLKHFYGNWNICISLKTLKHFISTCLILTKHKQITKCNSLNTSCQGKSIKNLFG